MGSNIAKKTTSAERGAGMVEFSLLIALVGLVGMASLSALGQNVSQKFSHVAHQVACGANVNGPFCSPDPATGD